MKLIVSTFLVYKVKKCLQKSGKVIFILPKLLFSVWALVARLVIPRCPSLVHQLPITCSPRDRLMGMVGTRFLTRMLCSFLYLVDYIVSYSYCKLTIIFSIPNSTCQSSILFLVSIYILHSSS